MLAHTTKFRNKMVAMTTRVYLDSKCFGTFMPNKVAFTWTQVSNEISRRCEISYLCSQQYK